MIIHKGQVSQLIVHEDKVKMHCSSLRKNVIAPTHFIKRIGLKLTYINLYSYFNATQTQLTKTNCHLHSVWQRDVAKVERIFSFILLLMYSFPMLHCMVALYSVNVGHCPISWVVHTERPKCSCMLDILDFVYVQELHKLFALQAFLNLDNGATWATKLVLKNQQSRNRLFLSTVWNRFIHEQNVQQPWGIRPKLLPSLLFLRGLSFTLEMQP